MADFEDRIASWRRELSSAMEDRPEVVDELEDHLRQEIETLTRAGKAPDEAWDAAVARLGDPRRLAREFTRSARGGWMPARVAMGVVVGCALAVGAFLVVKVSGGRFGPLIAAHLFAIVIGYGAMFAVGFSAAAAVVSHSTGTFGPRQAEAFRRTGTQMAAAAAGLTLAGIVFGALWLRAERGHYWDADAREWGGLCILIWNCVFLACIRGRMQFAMVAGVAANAVVAIGWFGAAIVHPPRQYGMPGWSAPVLTAFVMTQLALALAGLLPSGWLARRAGGQGTA
jgi:hypothetical protein